MSAPRAFTEYQNEILKEAYHSDPDEVEERFRERLNETKGEHLNRLHDEILAYCETAQRKLKALPKKRRVLNSHISEEASFPAGSSPTRRAYYMLADGVPTFINWGGRDIEQSIIDAYVSLEEAISSAKRLSAECTQRISEYEEELRNPFHGKEHQTPYKQILALPATIDAKQKKAFAVALDEKRGTIDLVPLNRTNAATVVNVVLTIMKKEGLHLSRDQMSKIKILCIDGTSRKVVTFPGYGKQGKDKRARYLDKHYASGKFSKLADDIREWKDGQESA